MKDFPEKKKKKKKANQTKQKPKKHQKWMASIKLEHKTL